MTIWTKVKKSKTSKKLIQKIIAPAPPVIISEKLAEDGELKWPESNALLDRDSKEFGEVKQGALFRKTEEQCSRDEFLAVASHELRTPLTSMRLHNDLVRMISEKEGQSVSKEHLTKLLNLMDQQIFRL